MQTLREKITFTFSALLYLVFNLGHGTTPMEIFKGTVWQLLSMLPYTVGVTWFIVIFLKHMAGGEMLPWDRIMRIFFIVGILFAMLLAIYQYAEMGAAV